MNITVDSKLTFQDCIRSVAKQVIAHAATDGTVGIGRDCMWVHCCRYLSRHPKSPRGTNGAYMARQEFNAIMAEKPFAKFVYV